MNILVTGANGFVGTHLCIKLLSHGHTVYGLVRTPSKVKLTHKNFILIEGDLNHSDLSWTSQLPENLNTCIHTAGIVHSYQKHDFYKINVQGTKYLIEALKKIFPIQFKFILVSSLAAAGPVNFGETKDETDIDFPVSEYGRSKKQAEEILKTLAPTTWISSIVRPPMVIGPGDAAVLDIFKMVKDGFILLPGLNSKKKEYSFVCVFDLVETIIKLMDSGQSLFVYSAFDKIIKFQELIEEIKSQMKKKWIIFIPLPYFIIFLVGQLLNFIHHFFAHQLRLTPDKIFELRANAWTCDASTTKSVLGQDYQYNLQKTIAVTMEDYKKRKWI